MKVRSPAAQLAAVILPELSWIGRLVWKPRSTIETEGFLAQSLTQGRCFCDVRRGCVELMANMRT